MASDRWHELCMSVGEDDGLPTWDEAHHGTEQKLYFWHRYIQITTSAMVGNPAFPDGIVYVDLFAGAGICTLRESKKRIPGSVLIAANAPKPFARIIACEENPTFAKTCRTRLSRTVVKSRCHVLVGDCNRLIDEIVALIPHRSLTLAFVDPKGLDAQFQTMAVLSRERRVDFVALFPDAYDISRNAEYRYRKDPNSKLDQNLGPDSGWRKRLDSHDNPTGIKKRRLFAEIYIEQLKRHLGYRHFRQATIPLEGRPLYSLIYASKHELGLKFWDEALKKEASGQRRLF